MVFPPSRFFSTTTEKTPHRPLLNAIPQLNTTTASRLGSFNQQYATFWRRFKSSPELYGIINILVTDIIGDRPFWTKPDGSPLGRNKRIQAEKLWRSNRIKETLKAILFDEFVTGDGYGWKAKATEEQKAKAVKEAMRQFKFKLKSTVYNKVFLKAMQDEDLKTPKKFDYIASSTVHIGNTLVDITGYTQVCNGNTVEFTPEEVLHFRLNTFDGNVQGFSPVQALIKELVLLYFVKGNMLAYLENGGKADILYTLENAQPDSNSYNAFKQMLGNFVQLEESHGYLLATGKTDVKDLSFGKDKDMEYQNLALYVLSSMLFAFGIPISRVPFLIGKAATAGDSGGLAEAGYQSMISEKQDTVEDIMNSQFFEEFGWHMHLSRHYKQDEVRESQTRSVNADTVTKLQEIYRTQNKKLTTGKINELLDVSEDDLEDLPEDEHFGFDTGLRNQNLLDDLSVEKEPDNRKKADTKRNIANESANKGMNV